MHLIVCLSIVIFTSLLFYMSIKQGTLTSISLLAKYNWLLLLIAISSQCLLLYPMLELTPVLFKWIPFIGCGSILFTGITNILNKEDETIHMICAILSFILFSSWVLLLKPVCILPMIICGIAGKENLKWRLEIGLIISVYMTLLLII